MLKPRCMPGTENPTGLYYSSEGYILPCCYLDTISSETNKELKELGMFDTELLLSNNEKIEDILNSAQWLSFNNILKNKPACAPERCRKICGK